MYTAFVPFTVGYRREPDALAFEGVKICDLIFQRTDLIQHLNELKLSDKFLKGSLFVS